MADGDKDIILRSLHDLVATCNDAVEGYAKAAKGIHDTNLTNWLEGISNERDCFVSALDDAVKKLGGKPRSDLHEGGILHRGWVDLETRIRPKTVHDILQDCSRGDGGTLKHYDHVLSENLPPDIRSLIENQRTAVERDLSEIDRKISH